MMKIHSLGLALALGFVLPVSQAAVPFVDQPMQFRQPDGKTLTIYLSGNNYFAEQRLADGKLVVYDNNLKGYAYAVVSADGSELQSTGQLAKAPSGGKLTKALPLQSLQQQQPAQGAVGEVYEVYLRCRLLQDHLSGMTDHFAADEYQALVLCQS